MDIAGENKKLASRLESVDWKNPVVIEYTTRDTPQQNSPVEVAFYAVANKVHTTITMQICPLFGEIFTTLTLLDSLTVIDINGKHAS